MVRSSRAAEASPRSVAWWGQHCAPATPGSSVTVSTLSWMPRGRGTQVSPWRCSSALACRGHATLRLLEVMLLADLDGTLVDRSAAFTAWARTFLTQLGADAPDGSNLAWLLAADRDGYTPRADLAVALKDRFNLSAAVPDLVDQLLFEHVQHLQTYPGVPAALIALIDAGAVVVVVTNGPTAQQSLKMQITGLDDVVHDIVISEAAGVKKPDPAIFQVALAAATAHGGRGPAWMVGDHPVADIAGARASGLQTGWVSHHRSWASGEAPDIAASSTVEVLDLIGQRARGNAPAGAPPT